MWLLRTAGKRSSRGRTERSKERQDNSDLSTIKVLCLSRPPESIRKSSSRVKMIAASVATNAASSSSSKNTSSTTSSSSTTTDATSVDLTDSTIGIVEVAHLGGIKAGCRISGGAIDRTKPTFLLINASLVTAAIFDVQFANRDLTDAVNLVAVEPLGHGATTCSVEHFTYWDSAVMTLLVLDQLGLDRVYVLGMGQGAFIGVRMALLSPERVCSFLEDRETLWLSLLDEN